MKILDLDMDYFMEDIATGIAEVEKSVRQRMSMEIVFGVSSE